MKKNRLLISIAIFIIAAFVLGAGLSGCTRQVSSSTTLAITTPVPTLVPTFPPTAAPTPSPAPTPPNGFILPQEARRPIAVMIDNQGHRPLPQGGLNKAQIIYEALTEGGITRYMAMFWGVAPEKIGPVRSARHYFVEIAHEYDPIYVHIGGSYFAKEMVASLGVTDINGLYDQIFWNLTNDRSNWQDSYTSYDRIKEYAKKKNYSFKTAEKLHFTYSPVMKSLKSKRAVKANEVLVRYNSYADNRYVYDSKNKLYLRYRNGSAHMERNSGKQISAGNIIVQYVSNSSIPNDYKDRQELYLIGHGTGLFITCGKAVKINWKKDSMNSQTHYTLQSGKPVVLNPAQTWIQIVPPSLNVVMK